MATKHVDALEARLGVKLFHRTTRRLSLTEAGGNYLEACQRILTDIDEAEAAAMSLRVKASGVLRMSVPPAFGRRYVAPLIPEFSRLHPEVTVDLNLYDAQLDMFAGNWDLAIRIGALGDSSLQARRLGKATMMVCAAPSYLRRRGVPRRIGDLVQHNCLSYTISFVQTHSHWIFGKHLEFRAPISGNFLTNNAEALVAAAVAGQGIIYQPDYMVAEALERGDLVALELDKPTADPGGIYILYPPDRRPPAKVRVMIDYLVEAFSKFPS